MPLGRPLYEQTRDTRIADHEYWIQRLKRRTTNIGAPTPGVTVETFFLDSHTGSVSSTTVLETGVHYLITVQGTFSRWNNALIEGTPEADAMFPGSTAGRVSTQVGCDAECFFATPTVGSGEIGHSETFKIDLGGGPTHLEPEDGSHATPVSGHFYRYQVTGQGTVASFEIDDSPLSDNYGKLKIVIQALDATGSAGGGGTGTGSLLPDPTGEPDGAWLRTAGGAAVWDPTPNVAETDLSLSDVTTANVSTTKHGFAPKAPNDTSKALVGDGTWEYPTVDGGAA